MDNAAWDEVLRNGSSPVQPILFTIHRFIFPCPSDKGSPHETEKSHAKSHPNGCSWLTTALSTVQLKHASTGQSMRWDVGRVYVVRADIRDGS